MKGIKLHNKWKRGGLGASLHLFISFQFQWTNNVKNPHTHTVGNHNPINSRQCLNSLILFQAAAVATESELCSPGERHQIHESEYIVVVVAHFSMLLPMLVGFKFK